MKTKLTASVLVLAAVVAAAVSFRTANRADAAVGNCYSEMQGPSEPTVCS
jgi:hypothetical protein